MTKKVYVAAGHGGNDPGAVGNGMKEKDLTLSIAKHCQAYLKANGVTVRMSRTTDIDPGLNWRASDANKWGADLVVEIHINAGGGDGIEVYHSIVGGKGKTLAKNIENEVKEIGQNSRGLKTKKNADGQDYLGIIRMTNAPAVLVECAFIDTKKDIAIIDTPAEQKTFGEAIAKGILKTLGLPAGDTYQTLGVMNFRKRPDLNSDVIAQIGKGTKLTGELLKDGWLRTTYNGLGGYVRVKGAKEYCKKI